MSQSIDDERRAVSETDVIFALHQLVGRNHVRRLLEAGEMHSHELRAIERHHRGAAVALGRAISVRSTRVSRLEMVLTQ